MRNLVALLGIVLALTVAVFAYEQRGHQSAFGVFEGAAHLIMLHVACTGNYPSMAQREHLYRVAMVTMPQNCLTLGATLEIP